MSEQQQKPKATCRSSTSGPTQKSSRRSRPSYHQQPSEPSPRWMETVQQVKKAIREKVLESYHNGRAAGPATPRLSSGSRPRRQPARS